MRSSTLSTMKPLRPTTRPLRTRNTWTAASSSSSAMPSTSKSSERSATICCFSIAFCTLVSRSRSRAACSNSSSSAASCIRVSSSCTTESVSPSRNCEEGLDVLVVLLLGRPRRRTARSTSRCGTAGTAARGAGAGRTCCPSTSATGTCAAAGRGSPGWRRRGRRARSSGRPCACGPASPSGGATRRPP